MVGFLLELFKVVCVELYQFLRFGLRIDLHIQTSCAICNWYISTDPTIKYTNNQATIRLERVFEVVVGSG